MSTGCRTESISWLSAVFVICIAIRDGHDRVTRLLVYQIFNNLCKKSVTVVLSVFFNNTQLLHESIADYVSINQFVDR